MNKQWWLFALALVSLSAADAHAQVRLTFDSDTITVQPGATAVFSGTLTNLGASEVFLNEADISFADVFPFLTLQNELLLNSPFSLQRSGIAGSSVRFEMFRVLTARATPPNPYSGGLVLLGGGDPNATDSLVDVGAGTLSPGTFTLIVAAPPAFDVPEPGALAWILTGGLGGGGLLLRRAKRRRQQVST